MVSTTPIVQKVGEFMWDNASRPLGPLSRLACQKGKNLILFFTGPKGKLRKAESNRCI
jgi:hypothetical protein